MDLEGDSLLAIIFRFLGRGGHEVYRAYPVDSPLLSRGLQDWSGGREVMEWRARRHRVGPGPSIQENSPP